MRPRVELVYFKDCPHVEAARANISAALCAMNLPTEWVEWDRESDATPAPLRRHGSPTILVEGSDVMPARNEGNCCRVYPGRDGIQPVPSIESICSALAAIDKKTGEDQE